MRPYRCIRTAHYRIDIPPFLKVGFSYRVFLLLLDIIDGFLLPNDFWLPFKTEDVSQLTLMTFLKRSSVFAPMLSEKDIAKKSSRNE